MLVVPQDLWQLTDDSATTQNPLHHYKHPHPTLDWVRAIKIFEEIELFPCSFSSFVFYLLNAFFYCKIFVFPLKGMYEAKCL